jgi:hypothetical protein
MKRNWDTIRDLLTKVEACTLPTDMVKLSDFPEEQAAEVSYHMELLIDAGLVNGQMSKSLGPEIKSFFARKLTWEGHEFLDGIRSDTVWEKTKKVFVEQGVSMTFDLVKEGAKSVGSALLNAAISG